MDIREDDLSGEEIARFLEDHLDHMREITPPGSVYALDIEGLRAADITFWTAWDGETLLGCGALRELDAALGEVKSVRTLPTHRGRGVASRILAHITEEARGRSYDALCLETGAGAEFARARALYERCGFERCGRFADYGDDPNSVFMRKAIHQR